MSIVVVLETVCGSPHGNADDPPGLPGPGGGLGGLGVGRGVALVEVPGQAAVEVGADAEQAVVLVGVHLRSGGGLSGRGNFRSRRDF